MSVPVHCPECDVLVTETGYGQDIGEFSCNECDTKFERVERGEFGVATKIID